MVLLEFKMCLSRCSHCIGCCREQDQEGSGMYIVKKRKVKFSKVFTF